MSKQTKSKSYKQKVLDALWDINYTKSLHDSNHPGFEERDKELNKKIRRNKKKLENIKTKTTLEKIKFSNIKNELIMDSKKVNRGMIIQSNSSFISVFNIFDAFIIETFKELYSNDTLLENSDGKLTYGDLKSCSISSFAGVKSRFIEEEVERYRDKRYEQIKRINKLTGKKILKSDLSFTKNVLEVLSELRNIIVHSGGNVTNAFVNNIHDEEIKKHIKPGSSVRVDPTLINLAVVVLSDLIARIGLSLTRNKKDELLQEINNEIIIPYFKSEDWQTAAILLETAKDFHFDNETYLINAYLCAKKQNREKKVKALEKKLSDGGIKKIYLIAKLCIDGELSEACGIIKSLPKEEQINSILAIEDTNNHIVFSGLRTNRAYKKLKNQIV